MRTKLSKNTAPQQYLTYANSAILARPLFGPCCISLLYYPGIAPVLLLTLFGCCSGTPYETQGVSEENQNNLRTKMGVNPAQYRHIPEQHQLRSRNTMTYTTIYSGAVAGGFGPRSRLVRDLFGNCSGFTGRAPKKAEGMSNKSRINLP